MCGVDLMERFRMLMKIKMARRNKEMNLNTNDLNIIAPWETFNKKVKALFSGDPDILVSGVYPVDDGYAMDIRASEEKYNVLARVMPRSKAFGNVNLAIELYCRNADEGPKAINEYKTLFAGNTAVKEIREVEDATGTMHAYIRFWPEVLQFPNDDTRDFRGLWSGLAQDIAREIFEGEDRGIHFGTAGIDENLEGEE